MYYNKPHPFIFNPASVVLPGLVTFLIFLTLEPFEFHEFTLNKKIIYALIFASIVSTCVLGTIPAMKRIFPKWMQTEKWTIGKEFILFGVVLVVITLTIFVFILTLGVSAAPPLVLFQTVVMRTLLISIFPIITLILFEQNLHHRQQFKKAELLSLQLADQSEKRENDDTPSEASDKILFRSENGKIELQLHPMEVLYLKSDGNYVEINYQVDQGNTQSKLIRNRLKILMEQLPKPIFFHCHKRFVINAGHVVNVKGNARNFELQLRNCGMLIPVSRSNAPNLDYYLNLQT